MIGAEIGHLADEYGLQRDQGVVYGILEGYAATLSDSAGSHRLMLTTRFASPDKKDALMDIINSQDLKNEYNIRKLQIAKKVIYVAFRSGADTPEKIRSFIRWFFPLLEQFGASRADICTHCQEPIAQEDAHWVLRDGATAFRMHNSCADELKSSVGSTRSCRTTANGSLLKGLLGSFVGALLGALLWSLLQLIQFYTPIAGMAIGWLTTFGYGFMKGKTSKLRTPIATVFGVIGVLLGSVFGVLVAVLQAGGNLSAFVQIVSDDISQITGPFFIGLLFMLLGVFVSVKSEGRRTSDMVVTDLP